MGPGTILQFHLAQILELQRLIVAQPEQRSQPPEAGLGIKCGQRVFVADFAMVVEIVIVIALTRKVSNKINQI